MWPGQPRPCSGPSEKHFSGPPVRTDGLKIFTLHRKEWLSVAVWRLICKSTNNDTTEKDRNICNIAGPRAPFRTAGLPLPFVGTAAGNDMWFRQRAEVDFLVKEEIPTSDIHSRRQHAYGDVCLGASSVTRWVKHFKRGNTAIADRSSSGRPRIASIVTIGKID